MDFFAILPNGSTTNLPEANYSQEGFVPSVAKEDEERFGIGLGKGEVTKNNPMGNQIHTTHQPRQPSLCHVWRSKHPPERHSLNHSFAHIFAIDTGSMGIRAVFCLRLGSPVVLKSGLPGAWRKWTLSQEPRLKACGIVVLAL